MAEKNNLPFSKTHEHLQVNDRWIFWCILPIVPFLILHTGNDNSLAALLNMRSYYSDLLLAFLVTYLTGYYLRAVFLQADLKFDWHRLVVPRLKWLIIYAFLCPLAIALLVEILYLEFILGIPFFNSSIFYLELPLFSLVLLLINAAYTFLHFRKYNTSVLFELNEQKSAVRLPSAFNRGRHVFLVNSGAASISLTVHDIAYFIVIQKITFLVTLKNEKYLYNESLEKVMETLDMSDFFQLNRQMIASRHTIKGFENTATRKLLIHLNPSLSEPVFVAKAKAGIFLDWLKAGEYH